MDEHSDSILTDYQEKLDKASQYLTEQLRGIRTGRASPALVDSVRVEAYGNPTPLNQIAHISVPEPRQLMIKPFDASLLKEVEKALSKADLGMQPASDGKVVRLTLPPLSQEQRKKLVARVKELAETARVALRNARRDANKASDQAFKDHAITEDHNKELHDRIQELLKQAEAQVEDTLSKKSDEIMND
jgi:ribosome recycling factor